MIDIDIPKSHPRYRSLLYREKLIKGIERNIAVYQGLIAHGRGECFDYLIGEKTIEPALKAIEASVAALLLAKHPVISVNGNVASLIPREIVELADKVDAILEINIFYEKEGRREAIKNILTEHGAKKVYGVKDIEPLIPGLESSRGRVSREGIFKADTVFVPLEDGDRTEALKRMGKFIITVDLNPLSRTALKADITIVDNIVRAVPLMIKYAKSMKEYSPEELNNILKKYDNKRVLGEVLEYISKRLIELSRTM
jgi:4-phosphopantoate--beta-alanine ligase